MRAIQLIPGYRQMYQETLFKPTGGSLVRSSYLECVFIGRPSDIEERYGAQVDPVMRVKWAISGTDGPQIPFDKSITYRDCLIVYQAYEVGIDEKERNTIFIAYCESDPNLSFEMIGKSSVERKNKFEREAIEAAKAKDLLITDASEKIQYVLSQPTPAWISILDGYGIEVDYEKLTHKPISATRGLGSEINSRLPEMGEDRVLIRDDLSKTSLSKNEFLNLDSYFYALNRKVFFSEHAFQQLFRVHEETKKPEKAEKPKSRAYRLDKILWPDCPVCRTARAWVLIGAACAFAANALALAAIFVGLR